MSKIFLYNTKKYLSFRTYLSNTHVNGRVTIEIFGLTLLTDCRYRTEKSSSSNPCLWHIVASHRLYDMYAN